MLQLVLGWFADDVFCLTCLMSLFTLVCSSSESSKYAVHVRGEEWSCGCGGQGMVTTCSQLYELLQCPIDANSLEEECCTPPKESVSCHSPGDCPHVIAHHTKLRSDALKQLGWKIALKPTEAFGTDDDGLFDLPVCNAEALTVLTEPQKKENHNNKGSSASGATTTASSSAAFSIVMSLFSFLWMMI